jgi:arylsulfatase A
MSPLKHTRRTFLKSAAAGAAWLSLARGALGKLMQQRKPNIIYILTDDLGYSELGCYGQKKIRTPNIDKIAAEGVRFTQHYSGSPVCAPSRCTLMTGQHTGHCYIRDNSEIGGWEEGSKEGQRPLPPNTFTVGTMLQRAGYRTAAIGKWGLGGPGSTGEPHLQGFDHWYGYLCQRQAHNYYPTHLWRDGKKEMLEGNVWGNLTGKHYAPDLMAEDALAWIRANKEAPFFLYFATPVPHAALQIPQDSLREYVAEWKDEPYTGDKGYLPHPSPRACYAAMITRLDGEIGRIMSLLRELALDENTLVMFSSDNGPTFNGGTDSAFFDSAGPFRGLKCDVYEGGIRVPMIARWPGHITPSTTTDHVSAFWDVMPTLAEIAGARAPERIDGMSFVPTLLGKAGQRKHTYLYWEYFGRPSQAVRIDDWKGLRLNAKKDPDGPVQFYDLSTDIGEKRDVAKQHPDVVQRMREIMDARTPSPFAEWNFRE